MRVAVLDILVADARCDSPRRVYTGLINRQYASIMPQVVSCWCRGLGHQTFYATYYGQADPRALLPSDLDVLFVSTYTRASALAYALSLLYRREGTLTVVGGPHARAFPEDSLRFFDVVVGDCDRALVSELLRDLPRGEFVSARRPLRELPSVEERLPEIARAHFWRGRAYGTTVIPLLSSLGCPYACDFCTDWDRPYRLLPLDALEADLRFIAGRFPAVKVPFHDPNFAVKFDQVLDVMERLPPESRNPYLIQTSLSILRGSRLERLRATRCFYVAPGVESWADYANKAGVGARAEGRQKLEQVVARFQRLGEYVPGLQANFIFGLDSDRGDEPVDLTLEFMRRVPAAWANINVPTPFGGTPLYEEHRAEGRILETMPFAFYYNPYLVTSLRHYTAEHFYARMIRLFAAQTSVAAVLRRSRAVSGVYHGMNLLRSFSARRMLAEFRILHEQLRSDAGFRAFHAGEHERLPDFYAQRFRQLLGRYADLLSPEDLRPLLPRGSASPGRPGAAQLSAH
jgi:radical SAM superfamily enzyme YgiQ (UPF0313 family)